MKTGYGPRYDFGTPGVGEAGTFTLCWAADPEAFTTDPSWAEELTDQVTGVVLRIRSRLRS